MIEFCTKRRMLISIVGLGILTVLVLVLEEALTSGPINQTPTPFSANLSAGKGKAKSNSKSQSSSTTATNKSESESKEQQQQPCWMVESFEVLEECSQCSAFEVSSQSPSICVETGLKEKLSCKNSGVTYRSCHRIKSIEERNFLIFMFSSLLVLVLSIGAVRLRTSQLERITIKNIEKRLAAGQ